ncbi:unnamed protein product [marine sediment metagenome]|uniref:Uncharacterized protein n=1 Tax=marine sediment metagenome TaxID=412755 RepID=X1BF35_9ZZZZ
MPYQLISLLVGAEEPEEKRRPANAEEGNRREICEFLRSRGVKRALVDNEQYYFCENIDGDETRRD